MNRREAQEAAKDYGLTSKLVMDSEEKNRGYNYTEIDLKYGRDADARKKDHAVLTHIEKNVNSLSLEIDLTEKQKEMVSTYIADLNYISAVHKFHYPTMRRVAHILSNIHLMLKEKAIYNVSNMFYRRLTDYIKKPFIAATPSMDHIASIKNTAPAKTCGSILAILSNFHETLGEMLPAKQCRLAIGRI